MMENLTNLTVNNSLAIGLLILFILIAFIIVTIVLYKFLKVMKIKKINTKYGSAEFVSPNDKIELPNEVENQNNLVEYSYKFCEHNYFHLLNRVINLGAVIDCASYVKKCYINELLKIYSKAMYEDLILWVENVIKNEGSNLSSITSVLSHVESQYTKTAKTLEFKIYLNNETYNIQGIPEFLVQKFKSRYDPNQHTLMDQLLDIITDKFHPSWESKLVSMLDIMESLYRTNFVSLDNTLKSLNGELDHYFSEKYENN